MDREERDIRFAIVALHACAGVLIWLAIAALLGKKPASVGAGVCLGAGAVVGLIVCGPIYRRMDRSMTERAARQRAAFEASPEGRAYLARLAAVRAMPLDKARRAAEDLILEAEPASGPPPARAASLPCGVGELFTRYRSVRFGETGDMIEVGAVAELRVGGRTLVRIGWTEGAEIAVDPERGVVIDTVYESHVPDDAHEFPSVYHLIVFGSDE